MMLVRSVWYVFSILIQFLLFQAMIILRVLDKCISQSKRAA